MSTLQSMMNSYAAGDGPRNGTDGRAAGAMDYMNAMDSSAPPPKANEKKNTNNKSSSSKGQANAQTQKDGVSSESDDGYDCRVVSSSKAQVNSYNSSKAGSPVDPPGMERMNELERNLAKLGLPRGPGGAMDSSVEKILNMAKRGVAHDMSQNNNKGNSNSNNNKLTLPIGGAGGSWPHSFELA